MVANEKRDSTLSVYIIIKQVSKMMIFTKLCKVQKYFVKKSQNFDLAKFKCMSCKISHDDITSREIFRDRNFHPKQIPNESLINRVFVDVICFMKL